MNAWIIDTETASLKGGVVEFGAIALDKNLAVVEEVHSLINPERPIDPGAFAIHGISDDDVKDKPTLAQFLGVQTGPIHWIGHNAPFDERMCKEVLVASRSLCTLKLSRQYITGTTNHKLETLKKELGLPDQKSHSALGDCYTTRDLLEIILAKAGVSLEALFDRAQAPRMLTVMPWGKYKGTPMLSVPRPYREWLLNQDIDLDMRHTLTRLGDL